MDPDDRLDDDEPAGGWLDPDDRLWRHPSEVANTPWPSAVTAVGGPSAPGPAGHHGHDARIWSIAVLSGVVGALLATGVLAASGRMGRRSTIVRPFEQVVMPTSASTTPVAASIDGPVVSAAHRVRPTVVQLQVDGDKGHATGSGIMLRSDGHILTTNHLVDGASRIDVVLADGRSAKGRVIGTDPDTDVAVVKIAPASGSSAYAVAPIGSAGGLKVGEAVVAIGSPLGAAGGPSVTTGVVSALGRELEPRYGPPLLDMIETDAPITAASSGGPLVDSNGSVIGMTTNIDDTNTEGLGFAVPIDIARDAADQLIQTGHVVHVWMGVEGEDVDSETAGNLAIAGGALVRDVRSSSPAAAAGLRDRDIITAVDGRSVSSIGSLMVAMRALRPGQKVSVTFLREGQSRTCTVTLGVRPKNP